MLSFDLSLSCCLIGSLADSGEDQDLNDIMSIAARLRNRLMKSSFEKHESFAMLCEQGEQNYNRLIRQGKSEEEAFDEVLVEIVGLLSQADRREGEAGAEEEQDSRDVDAAREMAIQTNEEEAKKREKERCCKCISGNILEREVMQDCAFESSHLLKELGRTRFFRVCCAKKVECCEEHCKGRFNESSDIFLFKKAVRQFLELERKCMKWYPYHWLPYFEDVAEQLATIFSSWEGTATQSDEELFRSYVSEETLTMALDIIDNLFKQSNDSVTALPERGGAIPEILVEAARRHGNTDMAASSISSNGVEVIVLD
ncbi:hypothetical protein GUITHDRAFT_102353 [Guillardia theta CCMP2712]|uniref:Uncharacterized protein n=2 Tax=Guillardia theta TaxID=55529 RepID=L1JTJ7_GUITC|nr:hypothetical protein GUITHDRAFT_102353 [Guillardia theta CCMP2712]EKX51747.1 hypothetical protein GUITHDRAFT_102353 [Guillardia theta CCMP2712]|eukprot:XP_005838727.1 hypothetical protein GUITHDRAFT_102353 [Guillardia theta CCMP2712]